MNAKVTGRITGRGEGRSPSLAAKVNYAPARVAAGQKSSTARERADAVDAYDRMREARPLTPPPLPANAPRTRTPGQIEADRLTRKACRVDVGAGPLESLRQSEPPSRILAVGGRR